LAEPGGSNKEKNTKHKAIVILGLHLIEVPIVGGYSVIGSVMSVRPIP
jgi:hypothetical protein